MTTTTYAVVMGSQVDVYVDTRGQLGYALVVCDTIEDAYREADARAHDYHYGVEIVDMCRWDIV